ncbi:phytoene desaturase family protein [Lentisalinibacter orientalis]|uniref:phytoene desaturase family protein n=1 Tax=Lentisalinibacter orientalis TaxID=2992241 RepID=UPI003867AEAD
MNEREHVVIIGAGVGGMCAGALLARQGYRVTVCEKLNTVGGRTRTQDIEGYRLPRGAVSYQLRGILPSICEEVGAEFEVRPVSEMWFWIRGGDEFVPLPAKSGTGKMLEMFMKVHGGGSKKAMARVGLELSITKIGKAFRDRQATDVGEDGPTFREWLEQYTDNEDLLALFHAITSAVSAVNDFEYPARHWFAHFAATEARMDKYALLPGGFVSVSEALARVIEANGGRVLLETPTLAIETADGRATGVRIENGGQEETLPADIVISNTGPSVTVELAGEQALGGDYTQRLAQRIRPTPIVATYVVSDEPLFEPRSAFLAAGLERIVTGVPLTNICPEWSHDGRHLTSFYGTPRSCLEPMDREDERRANMADVRTLFPDFDAKGGRFLDVQLRDIDDPDVVARSWPGYNIPVETPLPNLFNVGDGCGPQGYVATPAAAKSARMAVDRILEQRMHNQQRGERHG